MPEVVRTVNPHMLDRPLRVLRGCLHLLVAALLVLAAGRAVATGEPAASWAVAAALLVAAVYAAGALLPIVRRSAAAAGGWLAVVGAAWLLLLWSTADGVWLAFPLFFLLLHLLPVRWAVAAVAATTALAIAGFAWHQGTVAVAMVIGPVLGAAVAVAVVLGYQALYRESERRRQLIEQLERTRADLAVAERTAGVLAERERLASEIHDTVAQGLSSIQLLLRAAERALPGEPQRAMPHVVRARQTAQENLTEARRLVQALTPAGLDGRSLVAALQRLCDTVGQRSGLPVRLHVSGEVFPLPTAYEVALLRIAQSALANTVQHAGAGRAELTLSYLDASVALDVVDDGVGFDPQTTDARTAGGDGGFGLAAMRARARSLGGSWAVETAPGRGTAVAVGLPRKAGDAAAVPAVSTVAGAP